MILYKAFDLKSDPIPLNVDPKTFRAEFLRCIKDNKSDLTLLRQYMQPFMNMWIQQFQQPEAPRSFGYVLLILNLYAAVEDPFKQIEIWKQEVPDIQAELDFVFVRLVRKFNKIVLDDFHVKRVISLYFKGLLRREILKARPTVDKRYLELSYEDEGYEPSYPDHFFIKHLNLSPWEHYMFLLESQGYSLFDIRDFSKIPRETFYYEEKGLWKLLKHAYLMIDQSPISKH